MGGIAFLLIVTTRINRSGRSNLKENAVAYKAHALSRLTPISIDSLTEQ
jgi:hypothetical protein